MTWVLVGIALLQLAQILQGRQIVAAIDDLTAAVDNLEKSSTMVVNKINELKAGGTDPVVLAAVTARINTVTNSLNAASA